MLEDGSLFEIRRGHDRFRRVDHPFMWGSLNAWMQDADVLSYTSPSYRTHWNADQMFVAQWLPKSNMEHIMPPAATVHAARETLRQTRDIHNYSLHQEMTAPQREELFTWLHTCEAHVGELERGTFQIGQPFSEILVVDAQTGYTLPLFMNLEMGVLGIRRFIPGALCAADPNIRKGRMMTVVGYSFAELGIVPSQIYKYEMGGYFRIL